MGDSMGDRVGQFAQRRPPKLHLPEVALIGPEEVEDIVESEDEAVRIIAHQLLPFRLQALPFEHVNERLAAALVKRTRVRRQKVQVGMCVKKAAHRSRLQLCHVDEQHGSIPISCKKTLQAFHVEAFSVSVEGVELYMDDERPLLVLGSVEGGTKQRVVEVDANLLVFAAITVVKHMSLGHGTECAVTQLPGCVRR